MSKEEPKILIAAGGTGGHIFPAIAIADEMKKLNPNTKFLFIGTKGKIESRVVPQQGYKFAEIWISGLHRSLRIDNLLFPLKIIVSLVQSYLLIKQFRPDLVLGTGGYVCGPVLFVASLVGLPTVIHESNSFPGITTRMLSTRATRIFTAFDATTHWLKQKNNIELVGTPTREILGTVSREDGLRFFNLDPSKKAILVFGGSLGATSINHTVKKLVDELGPDIQWIWQTGKTDEGLISEMSMKKNCWVNTFIDKMEYAYAAADVVICRAGALTLAELTRLGKAAILIPYPHAAADHQTFNARALTDEGAALLVTNRDVHIKLKNELAALLNDEMRLRQISEACQKFGKPKAGSEIARRVFDIVK